MKVEADILERADAAFAEALVEALDIREHEAGDHSKRVACHTLVLARRFTADTEQLRQIYWGALLHDIGKIGIADAILLKQGALNEDEWLEMRTHPEKGAPHRGANSRHGKSRPEIFGEVKLPIHALEKS